MYEMNAVIILVISCCLSVFLSDGAIEAVTVTNCFIY